MSAASAPVTVQKTFRWHTRTRRSHLARWGHSAPASVRPAASKPPQSGCPPSGVPAAAGSGRACGVWPSAFGGCGVPAGGVWGLSGSRDGCAGRSARGAGASGGCFGLRFGLRLAFPVVAEGVSGPAGWSGNGYSGNRSGPAFACRRPLLWPTSGCPAPQASAGCQRPPEAGAPTRYRESAKPAAPRPVRRSQGFLHRHLPGQRFLPVIRRSRVRFPSSCSGGRSARLPRPNTRRKVSVTRKATGFPGRSAARPPRSVPVPATC